MRRGPDMIAAVGSLCVVTACAGAQPRGPTVMALPAPGKSLAVFQKEDGQCRNYAAATVGYVQPGQAGTHAAVGTAAGTSLGAAAGSTIGAPAGNAGAGAAIGGAGSHVGGTAVGANNAATSEHDLQTHYNIAYTQCIYSLGNSVQNLPQIDDGYYGYADEGYPRYGYPGYDWGAPGFFAGGVFAFGHDHDFDRHHFDRDRFFHFHDHFRGGFHDRFPEGFHGGFHEGFHGGFHGGGAFHG